MLYAIATLVWGRKPSCPSCSEGGSPGLCASHHHTSRDSVCEGPADWPHCGSIGKIKPLHAVPPGRVRPPPATLRPLVPAPGVGPHAPRCPSGAGLARACRRRPTPAAGQPCRPPAGPRPAPPGTGLDGGLEAPLYGCAGITLLPGPWAVGSVTDSCVMTPWRKGAHASRAIARKALAGKHRTNYIDIQQVVKQSQPASIMTLDKLGPSFTGRIRISTAICYASSQPGIYADE